MDARATVEAYYESLRVGEPLGPFFAEPESEGDAVVKFGVSERLVGVDAIRDGLAEQTRTTTDWTVESRSLRVTERDRHAWFSDDVAMAWTDEDRDVRLEFETRWSGTLERRDGDDSPETPWRFVGMHVSTAREI